MSKNKWGNQCQRLFWRGDIVVLRIKATESYWLITISPEGRAHFENHGKNTGVETLKKIYFFSPFLLASVKKYLH